MSVEIRPAVAADLPTLLDLYEQLSEGADTPPATLEPAQAVFDDLVAQPGRTLLVAVADGKVVGTADLLVVSPNLHHEGRPWASVEYVVVDRHSRRRGAGRALMLDVVRRAREAGCYKLQLVSNRRRAEAHDFYRSVGFEDSAIGFRWYF
ncbi:MAG: GNAT family N-acetyltransferase [Candidatus Dormibacteria bacterium]